MPVPYHHLKGGIYRLGDLPAWALDVAARIQQDGLMPYLADQTIANAYEPGAGISAHVDLSAFDDTIHAIPARTSDLWQDRELVRGRRVSLTFRRMLHTSGTFTS